MNTESWLKERRNGIGGSDVAAIVGVSPWRTAYDVWLDKTGDGPASAEPNDAMKYGLMMEPVLRQWYAEETGQTVRQPGSILVHPVHEYMLSNVDGLTNDRVVEIKTARSSGDWGDPGSDEIPEYYRTQVEHYMMVTGFELADVVVSFAGAMPVIYTVEADGELQELLIEKEAKFWELVKQRVPPVPVSYSDMVARFRKSVATSVTASEKCLMAIEWLKAARENIKKEQADEESYKAIIMGEMGEAEALVGPDGKMLVTWKQSKPTKRFNSKAFEADHPELYAQYLRESEAARRFLLKG